MLLTEFHLSSYNALPGVEEAYESLKRHPRLEDFLCGAASLFRDNGFDRDIGVFLLHRHFVVGAHQVPVETSHQWGNVCSNSLVTTVRDDNERLRGVPSRFRLVQKATGCQWQPLEFSLDDAVRRTYAQLLASDVSEKFAELLLEFELHQKLGLAIAARSALRTAEGEILIEKTDLDSGASVVTVARDIDHGSAIPTVWVASRTLCWCEPQYRCHVWCLYCGTPDERRIHDRLNEGHRRVSCCHGVNSDQ